MTNLDHIGIAVESLTTAKKIFEILGFAVSKSEIVNSQGVKAHFLQMPIKNSSQYPHIELLESIDPEGVVAKFIQNRGPGVHHLSFQVEKGKLDIICTQLKNNGFNLIYKVPQKGAQNCLINFVHPRSSGGILIELMELLD